MCVITNNYYSCGHIRSRRPAYCPLRGADGHLETYRDGDTSSANCGAPQCNTPPSSDNGDKKGKKKSKR